MGWLILAIVVVGIFFLMRYAGKGSARSAASDHARQHGEAGGHQYGQQRMGPF